MRRSNFTIAGTTRYNDSPDLLTTTNAYVTQIDALLPSLTVRESLLYAASLRLPSSTTPQQRERLVEEIIFSSSASRNALIRESARRIQTGWVFWMRTPESQHRSSNAQESRCPIPRSLVSLGSSVVVSHMESSKTSSSRSYFVSSSLASLGSRAIPASSSRSWCRFTTPRSQVCVAPCHIAKEFRVGGSYNKYVRYASGFCVQAVDIPVLVRWTKYIPHCESRLFKSRSLTLSRVCSSSTDSGRCPPTGRHYDCPGLKDCAEVLVGNELLKGIRRGGVSASPFRFPLSLGSWCNSGPRSVFSVGSH